jgi:hypothetical protein
VIGLLPNIKQQQNSINLCLHKNDFIIEAAWHLFLRHLTAKVCAMELGGRLKDLQQEALSNALF